MRATKEQELIRLVIHELAATGIYSPMAAAGDARPVAELSDAELTARAERLLSDLERPGGRDRDGQLSELAAVQAELERRWRRRPRLGLV